MSIILSVLDFVDIVCLIFTVCCFVPFTIVQGPCSISMFLIQSKTLIHIDTYWLKIAYNHNYPATFASSFLKYQILLFMIHLKHKEAV